MKRFHVHVGVKDLKKSIDFYTNLFGQGPTKQKADYAKWMLEDPRINFAISTRSGKEGVDHFGFQVDEAGELLAMTEKLKKANLTLFDEGTTTCCYATSEKAWVKDPSGIAWEAYHTMSDAEVFSGPALDVSESSCCPPKTNTSKKSCC